MHWLPTCISHYSKCKFIVDFPTCSQLKHHHPLVFSIQGIHPVDVRSDDGWPESWCCVHAEQTSNGQFPQVSLPQKAQSMRTTACCSSICPGAILLGNGHVSALVAATRLKAERCTVHGQTIPQAMYKYVAFRKPPFVSDSTFWFSLVY